MTVILESLLNWAVDPLSQGGELELLLLLSLVERQGEVFSVVESERFGSCVPNKSLSLFFWVEWLSDNSDLLFVVLDSSLLAEGVLWSVLSSEDDDSSVKLINALNRCFRFFGSWLTCRSSSLGVSSLSCFISFGLLLFNNTKSFLSLSLLRFWWG